MIYLIGIDEMNHRELVERAERWLTHSQKCYFAIKELDSMSGEIPDVIGWKSGVRSILVECKTSRTDFRKDQDKNFRKYSDMGMGMERYYFCPVDIIKPDEIPKNWGLVWVYPKTVRIKKKARRSSGDCYKIAYREQYLLVTALRKISALYDINNTIEESKKQKRFEIIHEAITDYIEMIGRMEIKDTDIRIQKRLLKLRKKYCRKRESLRIDYELGNPENTTLFITEEL